MTRYHERKITGDRNFPAIVQIVNENSALKKKKKNLVIGNLLTAVAVAYLQIVQANKDGHGNAHCWGIQE